MGDEISVDRVTDLPLTKRGNKHLLHVVEGFLGNEEAYALKENFIRVEKSLHASWIIVFGRDFLGAYARTRVVSFWAMN